MTTAGDALRNARADIGYAESPAGSNNNKFGVWYGLNRQPWCAMAISKWFHDAGLPLPASSSKGFAYTPSGATWFKQQGRWGTQPKVGAVVFYDFPGDGVNRISHVGIVEAVEGGAIVAIEGNTDSSGGRTSGQVMRRRRSSGIVGYGYPAYDGAPAGPPAPERQLGALPLAVDGGFGANTIAAMQRACNSHGARLEVDGQFGPASKRGLQERLHYAQRLWPVDGVIGPNTIRALQRHVGAGVDGAWGPQTTRALQSTLNRNGF